MTVTDILQKTKPKKKKKKPQKKDHKGQYSTATEEQIQKCAVLSTSATLQGWIAYLNAAYWRYAESFSIISDPTLITYFFVFSRINYFAKVGSESDNRCFCDALSSSAI